MEAKSAVKASTDKGQTPIGAADLFDDKGLGSSSPVYKVEKILECRVNRRRTEYLVKWEGFSPEDNTWEPAANIVDKSLIESFLDNAIGKRKPQTHETISLSTDDYFHEGT